VNYFEPKNAAERYSKGRPYFHTNIISQIQKHLRIDKKLDNALDIACGTGLSTKALLDIAVNVFGTDASEEMLKWALYKDKINYSIAQAENQPFSNNEFNLITVCSGIHWFNIDKFLVETNRLLTNNGWLVLYDNYFISEMQDVESFSKWYPEVYLKRFPAPMRNNSYNWSNANLASYNFILDKEEEFKNSISFTKDELVLYFTTQSNITAVTESGEMTYKEVEVWLYNELTQFYSSDNTRIINFGNWIKYLQRNNDKPCL
jgi:ubiquinone/menaquinone biosynthesis C-methylase UbiE